MHLVVEVIVSRGDWLGKPAYMKVENNGAVVYVGSSLTMHSPLFFSCSQFGQQVQNDRNAIERCARSGLKISCYP